MMIPRCLVLSFLFFSFFSSAGQLSLDSLLTSWESKKAADPDTTAVNLLIDIATAYQYDNTDTALYYCGLAEEYARSLDFTRGLARSLTAKGTAQGGWQHKGHGAKPQWHQSGVPWKG
jgi:hypothetical protein